MLDSVQHCRYLHNFYDGEENDFTEQVGLKSTDYMNAKQILRRTARLPVKVALHRPSLLFTSEEILNNNLGLYMKLW